MSKRVLSMVLAVLLLASVWTPAFAEEGPEEPIATEETAPANTPPAEPEDTDEAEAAPTEAPAEEPKEPVEDPAGEPEAEPPEEPVAPEATEEPSEEPVEPEVTEEPEGEELPEEEPLPEEEMPIDEAMPVADGTIAVKYVMPNGEDKSAAASKVQELYEYVAMPDSVDGYWLELYLNMQYSVASIEGGHYESYAHGFRLDKLTGETGHSYSIQLDDDVSAVTITLKKEAPTDLEDTKVIPITYVDPQNKISNKNDRGSGFANYIKSWDSFDVDLSDKNYTLQAEGAYINSVFEEGGKVGYDLSAEQGAESITVTVVEAKGLELDTSRSVYKDFKVYADAACTQPFSGMAKTGTIVYIPTNNDVYYVSAYARDCNVQINQDDGHNTWQIFVMDRNGDGKCSFSVLPLPVLDLKGASSKVTFTYTDYLEDGSRVKVTLKNGDRLPYAEKSVDAKLEKGYAVRGDIYYIETGETILCDEYTVDEYGNIVNDQPDGKSTVYVYQPKQATVKLTDPDGVFDIYKVEPSGMIIAPSKNGASVPEGTTLYFVYKNKANKGSYRVRADGLTLEEGPLPELPIDLQGFTDPDLEGMFCWSVKLPTAVEKGWKTSYTFTAEPSSNVDAPVAAAENVSDGVKISWAPVTGAVKYQVYYRTSTKKSWTKLGEPQTGTDYTYTAAKSGTTYYFAVRCVTEAGSAVSSYSNSVTNKYLAAPAAPPTAALADTGIKITWKKVTGASKYQVYYRTSGTGDWTLLTSTKSTSYTWKEYASLTDYEFAVQTVNGSYVSAIGGASSPIAIVGAPTAVAENAADGVKISWAPVTGAEKYQVYYRTSTKKSWTKLGEARTDTDYTYTAAKSGSTYYFTVRCVTEDGSVASPYSTSIKQKFIAAPKAPTAALSDTGIKISWKKVTGASYYQVYVQKNGTWEALLSKPTKSTSCTWGGATSNEPHVFAVRCTDKGGTTYYSAIGVASTAITIVDKPQNVEVENTAKGVKISWDAVTGAEKYRVYYRTSTKKGWSKLSALLDGSQTDFTWDKAKKGTTYYFMVRCMTAGDTAASPYSASVTRKYLTVPTDLTAALADTGIKITWKKVTGASKYQVYYRNSGAEDWTPIISTKSTSCTWGGYTSLTEYEFAVEAVNGDHVSERSAASAPFAAVEAPKNVTVTNDVGGVKISWDAVAGAKMYRVYYATKKTGSLKKVTDIPADKTECIWAKAKKGSTYYYVVRCVTEDGKAAASPYSTPRVACKYVVAPTVKAAIASTGIKLSWSKSSGASKYQLYYREGAGEWQKLVLTKSTSYTWKEAKPGVAYTFTAEATDKNGNALSARKEDGTAITMAAKPELSFEMTEGGLKISWAKDGIAAQYRVYYGTKKSSLKKLGDPVTDGSYTWSGAKAGKTYYFSVRPLTESGALAGPYSAVVSFKVPK